MVVKRKINKTNYILAIFFTVIIFFLGLTLGFLFDNLRLNYVEDMNKESEVDYLSLQSQYAYRVISAKWIDSSQEGFRATLSITGIDDMGLVNEVTRLISNNLHVNIHNINISGNEGFFQGHITVSIKNNKQLTNLIQLLKKNKSQNISTFVLNYNSIDSPISKSIKSLSFSKNRRLASS